MSEPDTPVTPIPAKVSGLALDPDVECLYQQNRLSGSLLLAGPEALARLAAEVFATAPPDRASGLVLPLIEYLIERMDEPPLRRYIEMSAGDYFDDFVATVNAPADGARRVVFVVSARNYKVNRQALYLKSRGYRTFLISLHPIHETMSPVVARVFDTALTLTRSYLLLETLLERLEPEIFHVHCNMWNYALGRVVIEARGGAGVVAEFDDIFSVYAAPEALATNWDKTAVSLDLAMERFICHRADGLLHQFSPDVDAELRERHGALPPVVHMPPWPAPEFSAHSDDKLSDRDGVRRLVWAGAICPPTDANPASLMPSRGLPDAILTLLETGLGVDLLVDPAVDIVLSDPVWRIYTTIGEHMPLFNLRRGLPMNELAGQLCRYDFGMILFNLDPAVLKVSRSKLKFQTANKFFAYLEAGLPVVVNAEFEYMASLVRGHGIGIAVHSSQIGTVARRVREANYDRMAANVRRFNQRFSMAKAVDRLERLYDDIIAPRTGDRLEQGRSGTSPSPGSLPPGWEKDSMVSDT